MKMRQAWREEAGPTMAYSNGISSLGKAAGQEREAGREFLQCLNN